MGVGGKVGFESYIQTHNTIKVKGFFFLVISPMALNKKHIYTHGIINWAYFRNNQILEFPLLSVSSFSDYNLGEYDINSTDLHYQNEVQRLKSTFFINPNATFRAYKISTYEVIGIERFYYTIYVFDFDDIFLNPDSTIFIPFTLTTLWGNEANFGFPYNPKEITDYSLFLDELVPYRGFSNELNLNVFHDRTSTAIPVFKDDNDISYFAQSVHLLYKKNGVVYFVRNTHLPTLTIDKSKMIVRYDVYIFKGKCCLAQCFGITEKK